MVLLATQNHLIYLFLVKSGCNVESRIKSRVHVPHYPLLGSSWLPFQNTKGHFRKNSFASESLTTFLMSILFTKQGCRKCNRYLIRRMFQVPSTSSMKAIEIIMTNENDKKERNVFIFFEILWEYFFVQKCSRYFMNVMSS